jgi:RNA-directed DNA polymerase
MLMEEVLAAENLRRAWRRVKANRGAPGIDGMPIEDFAKFAREQWPTIRDRLVDGSYRPQPVRRVMIPKPGGGERPLGIPTVMDRLIQQAIAQVLTPIFDPEFSASNFGFRPNRSAHGALRQVQADIRAGHRFTRYADDLLILVRSQRAGERVKTSITAYLGRRLKLPVNEQKSRVAPIDQCVFLGFTFRKGKLRWSVSAFEDFKHRTRQLTGRSWGGLDGLAAR